MKFSIRRLLAAAGAFVLIGLAVFASTTGQPPPASATGQSPSAHAAAPVHVMQAREQASVRAAPSSPAVSPSKKGGIWRFDEDTQRAIEFVAITAFVILLIGVAASHGGQRPS